MRDLRPRLHEPGGGRLRRAGSPALVALCALAFPAHAAGDGAPALERARWLMGTLCTANVDAADSADAGAALDAAFDEIARLDAVLSSWRHDSELARLNALPRGARFACSVALYEALATARALAEACGGAFDPTIEPLARAWDVRGPGRVPDAGEIAAARARVGWAGLVLDSASATARFAAPGMGVDLGGIGKGFALDRAFTVLESRGVRRAQFNFGGEIRAMTNDAPWPVAVADPRDRTRPVLQFAIHAGAVSTSGQSERSFRAGGRHYGHILDPRTGRPVDDAGSVTVIAGSATHADALSTALFVMGRVRAEAFVRAHPEIAVLWLEPAGPRLLAWGWNLPATHPVAGAEVEWMDTADAR